MDKSPRKISKSVTQTCVTRTKRQSIMSHTSKFDRFKMNQEPSGSVGMDDSSLHSWHQAEYMHI